MTDRLTEREEHLNRCYEALDTLSNALGVLEQLDKDLPRFVQPDDLKRLRLSADRMAAIVNKLERDVKALEAEAIRNLDGKIGGE